MLGFKKRLWIIKQKQKGKLTDSQIAISQRTSRSHAAQQRLLGTFLKIFSCLIGMGP